MIYLTHRLIGVNRTKKNQEVRHMNTTKTQLIEKYNTTSAQIDQLIDNGTLVPVSDFSTPDGKKEYIFDAEKSYNAMDSINASLDHDMRDIFVKNGGRITTKKDGAEVIQSSQANWIAFFKSEYGDKLVSVGENNVLSIEKSTKDNIQYEELPAAPILQRQADLKYGLEEKNSSDKNIMSAMYALSRMGEIPQINPYEKRLELFKKNWDGKSRLKDVLPRFTGSRQDPELLELIAKSWFKGAVHNWVRSAGDSVYPMSMDINTTRQGTGKSYFASIILNTILGYEGIVNEASVSINLNDPANAYPVLSVLPVANDDEHATTEASRSQGTDQYAAIKNAMQLSSFTWTLKHSNTTETAVNRVAWIRTTNSARPYEGSMNNELERRHMVVLGDVRDMNISTHNQQVYMAQVLGEAYALYLGEGFNEGVDTLMPDAIKPEMSRLQKLGSSRGGLMDILDSMMGHNVPEYISSQGHNEDLINLLNGKALFSQAFDLGDMIPAHAVEYYNVSSLESALRTSAKRQAFPATKDAVSATVQSWLKENNFVEEPRTEFRVGGVKFKGSHMVRNTKPGKVKNTNAFADFNKALSSIGSLMVASQDQLKELVAIGQDAMLKLDSAGIENNPQELQKVISKTFEAQRLINQP